MIPANSNVLWMNGMRSEKEMMDLILNFVTGDDNIRVAVMIGSRANPNVKRDFFQDYDIACFVNCVDPYVRDRDFLKQFGELMIIQTPEDMEDPPPKNDGHYGYLMQFMDGNRIDIGFAPLDSIRDAIKHSLTVVLVDKDNIIGEISPASDRDYLQKEPTAKAFDDCCNEIWWVCPYAAKGIWREELTYAKSMIDSWIRPSLMKMMGWYFGIRTGFEKSPGKEGKYIKNDLEPSLWTKLENTYSDSNLENIWDSLFTMGDLFRTVAHQVADVYGFEYPEGDDYRVTNHLKHVRRLPKNAKEMY